MAGRSWESLINKVKMLNYNITLCYNAVKNPKISVERVDKRVLEGGHFIPHNVIKRRYKRSLSFFKLYKNLCDQWYFFDNSNNSAILLAYKENGDNVKVLNKELFEFYATKI